LALTPGTHLGVYQIAGPIGEGGMGQVFRARDTKLDRDVAVKILPEAFAHDADRLARLTREAKTLASLNHPHIATIYGLEESAGMTALVMELVEGEDLSQRIARGAIPLDEALPIAKQIADALDAAHEQGIIHRDLKPANIKVRADGTVKVLDFGLAKAMTPTSAMARSDSMSPTITTPAMTQAGLILGTAAYMSPEQARGKTVDKRADVWAFGAVLFEMLTGTRAFPGEGVTDTLAAVVKLDPEWDAVGVDVPARVSQVLRVCLQKDLKQRAHDMADVRLALDGAFETAAPQTTARGAPAKHREQLAWTVAVLALIGLAAVSFLHVRETPVERPLVHLSVPLPGNTPPGSFALSPDGRSLAFRLNRALAIRSIESGEMRPLNGTPTARTPFWSPDSRTIAFFADRKLKTVAASGGIPQTLCDDVGIGAGGTWSRSGAILFATDAGVLTRVSPVGGACTALTKPEPGLVERGIPLFLPDGDHFLYVLNGTDEARRGLYVASLGDPNGRRLLTDPSSAVFVPNGPGLNQGRLLFVREQTLMGQPFDAASLQLSGEPVTVADHVSFTATPPQIAVSADTNGTLMYLANSRPERQMVWYDRSGIELGRAAMTGQGRGVSLAPDGKRVVFERTDAQGLMSGLESLWAQDLELNRETRLTSPPLSSGSAVWSPDGQRVAFYGTRAGAQGIYVKNVNSGKEDLLLAGSNPLVPSDWARDDHSLVYTELNPKTGADIWLLADPSKPSADRKPVPLLRTPSLESQGQISPDGKWLAYVSNESGAEQVYLRPFAGAAPTSDTKAQVSTVQGREPRWRGDGKELFYLESTGNRRFKMMSVPIGTATNPAGTPKLVFEFQSNSTVVEANEFLYSPAADGQRFLINVFATDEQPSLEVILNWGRTASGK
jgi:serine/threonine protein kinase